MLACMRACAVACVRVRVCVCVRACVIVRVCVRARVRVCVCVCVCVYAFWRPLLLRTAAWHVLTSHVGLTTF